MSLSAGAWGGSAALAPSVVSVLVGATVRGVIVLLLAAAVVRLWPRTSAAQRHVVWAVACGSLLLLPVLPLVVPVWRVPIPASVLPATTAVPMVDRVPVTDPQAVSVPVDGVHRAASGGLAKIAGWFLPESLWLLMVVVGWGSGTLVVLTVLLDSHRQVRRFALEARPLTDARMLDVLARAKSTVRFARPVLVKLHVSTMPMVCGVLRPVIVLPVSSCAWGEERLYNILVHELAHIRRYDSLTQAVASLACVLYWFNPLIWLAVRALQTEQEQACDDAVLGAGSRPREYATDLLELTQAFQPTRELLLVALPFARPSELQTRMQSIVDRSRSRSLVSRWGALAVWGAGLGVMYPLVGLTPHMQYPEHRSLIPLMGHEQMNTIKQTAVGASVVAGLLAGTPAARQAQVPVVVDSQAMFRDESGFYSKVIFSTDLTNIKYDHAVTVFMPMMDTRFHFVVVDGDNGRIVFNSQKDGVVCFPDNFLLSTNRIYYDEPSHIRIVGQNYHDDITHSTDVGWNPKYVNFSMVFHSRDKTHAIKLEECNYFSKGDGFAGEGGELAIDTTKAPFPHVRLVEMKVWFPQNISADTGLVTLRRLLMAVKELDKEKPTMERQRFEDSSLRLSRIAYHVQGGEVVPGIDKQTRGGEVQINSLLAIARDSLIDAITELYIANTDSAIPPLQVAYDSLMKYVNVRIREQQKKSARSLP